MNTTVTDRSEPVAWGILLTAHAGRALPGARVLSLHEQPLCLQAPDARLSPYDEIGHRCSEHAVFSLDDSRRAWITNRCQALSCRVNGAEMRPGERWMLADRDHVTIGLSSLSVVQSDSVQQWEAWDGTLPGSGAPDEAAALEALRALDDQLMEGGILSPADRPRNHGAVPADEMPSAEQDPLLNLANEFEQAIQGTHQGLRAIRGSPPAASGGTLPPPPDPFDAASPPPPTRMLLEGLLPESTDIDTIIAEMDEFEASELFSPAPRQDVLRLLAEQAASPAMSKTLATLSRREHHDLSIDSYFDQHLSEPTQ